MPWWFWVLLWGTLTIGSLAFLAWFVYRALTRGFMLLDLVATWMESIETRFDEAQANTRRKLPAEQSLGIFTPVTTAYNEYEQGNRHAGLSESSDGSPDEIDSANLKISETCSKHRKVHTLWVSCSVTRQLLS